MDVSMAAGVLPLRTSAEWRSLRCLTR